jgi:hypothetical protein
VKGTGEVLEKSEVEAARTSTNANPQVLRLCERWEESRCCGTALTSSRAAMKQSDLAGVDH